MTLFALLFNILSTFLSKTPKVYFTLRRLILLFISGFLTRVLRSGHEDEMNDRNPA
jgi:hypothetical protein